MTPDEMIAVLEAAKAGKQIEGRVKSDPVSGWIRYQFPSWDFSAFEYRVRPEPREWWIAVGRTNGRVCFIASEKIRETENEEVVHVREVLD